MRALKILVVVMGVMLVGGFIALIVSIAYTAKYRQPAAPAVSAATTPYAAPPIDVPAGARIEIIPAGANRLVLHVMLPDGNREIVVLDMASGRRLGTIPLRAAP